MRDMERTREAGANASVAVLLDNGHGAETAGKRSPDGRLREYAWARDIAKKLEAALKARGYDARRIVAEEEDIPLSERVRRANAVCREKGAGNCILVSIHVNAAGADGKWHGARGFSAHVGLNASGRSRALAQCLWDEAIRRGLKGNRSVPNPKYIAQNLAICRDTLCPAVLTENLFQDNREDVDFLLGEEGRKAVVDLHVEGIGNFMRGIRP